MSSPPTKLKTLSKKILRLCNFGVATAPVLVLTPFIAPGTVAAASYSTCGTDSGGTTAAMSMMMAGGTGTYKCQGGQANGTSKCSKQNIKRTQCVSFSCSLTTVDGKVKSHIKQKATVECTPRARNCCGKFICTSYLCA